MRSTLAPCLWRLAGMSRAPAPAILSVRGLPEATPETAAFWEGTRLGELRIQRCLDCRHVFFPPRPFCPQCARRRVEWFRTCGRATLYSYVINPSPPAVWGAGAQSCALVTLEEGVRVITCVVDCPQTPTALQLDMPLELTFRKLSDEIFLPVFRPAVVARR